MIPSKEQEKDLGRGFSLFACLYPLIKKSMRFYYFGKNIFKENLKKEKVT